MRGFACYRRDWRGACHVLCLTPLCLTPQQPSPPAISHRTGNLAEALMDLERALELDPTYEVSSFPLAAVLSNCYVPQQPVTRPHRPARGFARRRHSMRVHAPMLPCQSILAIGPKLCGLSIPGGAQKLRVRSSSGTECNGWCHVTRARLLIASADSSSLIGGRSGCDIAKLTVAWVPRGVGQL